MRITTLPAAVAVLGLLVPGIGTAQVAGPLPRAVGMADNYTALARGLAAPAWNPAGLGLPDSPGLSFTILPLGLTAGLSPVTAADLAEYEGQLIPRSARREWLDAITDAGGEHGTLGADVTYLALNIGRTGVSVSSTLRGRVDMAPDVAEVFFFGNAGLTGEPGDYSLEGSSFDVAGTTTVAASMAVPLPLTLGPMPNQHFAVGATVKYTIGNFLVLGQENGSTLSSDPIDLSVRFPLVHTPFPDSAEGWSLSDVMENGSGFGLDIGAAWQGGIFSAGLAIKNVINTFEWNPDNLRYREGTANWDTDTSSVQFDTVSIDNAPQELLDRIDQLYTFSPTLAAGAAAQLLPYLTVTGELRHSLEESLAVGARNHVGVGAELTILPVLPLRAGVAAISGGYQLAGGVGLKLGAAQLAFSAATRDTEVGGEAVFALGFTVGVR